MHGVRRYVTSAIDVYADKVARGMAEGHACRAPRAALRGHPVGLLNGVFAPQWLLRAVGHVVRHRWTTWFVFPLNDSALLPEVRRHTKHVQVFPTGTAVFVSNGDGYRSAPVPTKWPLGLAMFDFRPWDARIECPVRFPPCPPWARPEAP